MLWGEAGVGKSDLLARFGRWAERDRRACYVFLHNIHVRGDRLPRYVVKTVVGRLTAGRRREFRRTWLFQLLRGVMKEALRRYSDDPARTHSREEWLDFYSKLLGDHSAPGANVSTPTTAPRIASCSRFFFRPTRPPAARTTNARPGPPPAGSRAKPSTPTTPIG